MVKLTVIVPAYNEERRISPFLKDLISYSKKHFSQYEILVVDDGSTDGTKDVINRIIKNDKNARLITYKKNQGKGCAIQTGVIESKGDYIIFIDADGSIAPDQIPLMLEELKRYDVVVGSRGIDKRRVKESRLRRSIGRCFNLYVNLVFMINVWDNLCGFKGFRRYVAKDLFKNLIEKRWVFDVELFYKIRKKRYRICEIPITWVHKEGTKISVIDPLKMVFRLIVLRIMLLRNQD